MQKYFRLRIGSFFVIVYVFSVVLTSVQAWQSNKVDPRVKRQEMEEYLGEELKGRSGLSKAFRLATAPTCDGHQSLERPEAIGSSWKVRESSPNDRVAQSVGSDYVAVNSSGQEFRKVLSGDPKDNCPSEEAGLNHVFIEYKSETGENYPKYNVTEYSIEVKFNRGYMLEERVAVKEEGGRYIKDRKHGKGCLDKDTFKALRSKVYGFLSDSSRHFPGVREVEPRGPAKSSTLKVRPTPTEEQLVFRSHIGANPENYPTEFLDLIRNLDSIVHSKVE